MDIRPNPSNGFGIGDWEDSSAREDWIKFSGDRDFRAPAAVLPKESLAAAVQAAAWEAAWVGNLLAVLAEVEAWANPIGLS